VSSFLIVISFLGTRSARSLIYAFGIQLREHADRVIGFARADDMFRFPVLYNLSVCREDLVRNCEHFRTWYRFPFDEVKVVVNLAQGR